MIICFRGRCRIRNSILRVINEEKDSEIILCLQNLGINKSVARLIAYLKDMNERSYQDIERATGLRQPEVSIAMRALRERGWIIERDIKKNIRGRGKTSKIYALRQTLEEIIKHYEEKEKKESARSSDAICRLKDYYST